ncbi:MAG TPA: hypothetical protein VKY73_07040 [Polyangiaceae bacterium]|nr:hypothetical protein [Polyangiaceae bacterium]
MAKTPGDTLEDARTTALDLLADGFESLDRLRRARRRRAAPPEPTPELDSGDFLADFLQLHLQYLNRLAGLGSSYSILASRLLERVYDRCVGRALAEPVKPRAVSGVAGERRRVRVVAENLASRRVSFRVVAHGDNADAVMLPPSPIGLGPGKRRELDVFVSFDERVSVREPSRIFLESDAAEVVLDPSALTISRVPS